MSRYALPPTAGRLSRRSFAVLAGAAGLAGIAGSRARGAQPAAIRVGHFPNITHVQALIARALSRQSKGWFEQRLGRPVEWFAYNAGPSAMEAIFAESIDLTYVGPSPAINAYAKSRGEEIRIIAGALDGGSALVVRPDEGLRTAADFRGKKIGTPQLGNTQDVAARTWLAAGGLKITIMGGDAQVIPTANPDQLGLFRTKQLDAVWTVEPWVSRLELEADGKVLVDQRDAVTTVLVARAKFLASQRALVRDFARAHDELTAWVRANPEEAQKMVRDELSAEMRSEVSSKLVAHAWDRIVPTSAVSPEALVHFVADARQAGFLRTAPDLSRLVEKP
ncbi:MAG: ABC transporter substrate-binding protein [Alphaproteobacteria bacterium]|nr:ABC transporter substrate-binding protein [Alphaproteobacteria bacterium]